MLVHVDLATHFVAGMEFAVFAEDLRSLYATIRCLEIISEASRRVPEDVKARHPDIAWREMAGAGNVYRHDYEDVAARVVWDTIHIHLSPLRAVLVAEVERGDPG
jgi:uncharacterized protein with HEPN domain